jgi:hypothetical protein
MNYTIPPPTQANRKNADVVRMPAYGRFLSVPTGRLGSRLCENTLDSLKTGICLDCLRNQQTEARIAPVSYIGVRNAVWAAPAAQTAAHGRSNGGIHALIASSSPAMPKMLIIRLRL